MKTFLLLSFLALNLSSVKAQSFTPDHLEGIFPGLTLSEDNDYCSLNVRRRVGEEDVEYDVQVRHAKKTFAKFTLSAADLADQLRSHPSYLEFTTPGLHLQVNVQKFAVLNYTFFKLEEDGKLSKHLICSRR